MPRTFCGNAARRSSSAALAPGATGTMRGPADTCSGCAGTGTSKWRAASGGKFGVKAVGRTASRPPRGRASAKARSGKGWPADITGWPRAKADAEITVAAPRFMKKLFWWMLTVLM
jgi:hypothetical protein